MPAINCPKPGGNVSVETSKVTSAGYSRRLREREREGERKGSVHTEGVLQMGKTKTINIRHN